LYLQEIAIFVDPLLIQLVLCILTVFFMKNNRILPPWTQIYDPMCMRGVEFSELLGQSFNWWEHELKRDLDDRASSGLGS